MTGKKIYGPIIILLIFFSVECLGTVLKPVSGRKPPDHAIWENVLQHHVDDNGFVNYKLIQQNPSELNRYLNLLGSSHPEKAWSEAEQKAYWINAYNAFTIKLIVDHYPIKSIKTIGKERSTWDKKFIKIENNMYSLNDIEHQKLLKAFKDPRIHFVINCASISCPKLMRYAFQPGKLDEQLNQAAKAFINNTAKNAITRSSLTISPVFEWYVADFTENQSLIEYINQYSTIRVAPDAKINYTPYNWNLNDQAK